MSASSDAIGWTVRGHADVGQADEEVERFSADLARRVAGLLREDVFAIDADAAQMIRENYPGGYQWTFHMGGGPNPVLAEFRADRQGRLSIQLRMASGYRFWDATLTPRV